MKRLAILGASGHGKVIADAAMLSGWVEVVFFDDAWPTIDANGHWPVAGNTDGLLKALSSFAGVIVAIGNNQIRAQKYADLIAAEATLASIIHPSAIISPFACLGLGSFVAAGAVIQVDAHVGNFAIINTNAVVEHDCRLGAAVHVSPGGLLAGGVVVGDGSWIGIGACVKQQIQVGQQVVVGAGTVVVKNLPSNVTVVGNPARSIIR